MSYNTIDTTSRTQQSNASLIAMVGTVAVTVGVAVGYAVSAPATSSAYVTTRPVTTTTTRIAPSGAVRPVMNTPHYATRHGVPQYEEVATEEVYVQQAAQPSPVAPVAGVFGLGALFVAGMALFKGMFQQKATQPLSSLDLGEAPRWAMAAEVAEGSGAGKTIRIATRKSPLAMWQAEFIQSELERLHPGINVVLQPMSTRGDKILDSPLAKIGGKGLFVKELENALLEGRSDIAVHSTKDVPMELPEGLTLGIICKRHDPCDAIVFPKGSDKTCIADLPQGAKVGTSSLRRQCQLLLTRPDLKFVELRGNVNTRLAKLDSGDYDAIILAAAGLKRLGFADRIYGDEANIISPDEMLPAAGQGALSIELRDNDPEILELLWPLMDIDDAITVSCERAMNRRLNGGCQVPISGFARLHEDSLQMDARVGSIKGDKPMIIKGKTVPIDRSQPWETVKAVSEQLGIDVGDMLLDAGAQVYLDEAYENEDAGVQAQLDAALNK